VLEISRITNLSETLFKLPYPTMHLFKLIRKEENIPVELDCNSNKEHKRLELMLSAIALGYPAEYGRVVKPESCINAINMTTLTAILQKIVTVDAGGC